MDNTEIRRAFLDLLGEARDVAEDIDEYITELEALAVQEAPTPEEATRLLERIVVALRAAGANDIAHHLEQRFDGLVDAVVRSAAQGAGAVVAETGNGRTPLGTVELVARGNIPVAPVLPTPTFHGKEIPMVGGHVPLRDLRAWVGNERIEIHVAQFEQRHGRMPSADELLQILCSELMLPGLTTDDQFNIVDLARSIANNGVRRAPIISRTGTLLDGNRRVAACYYILNDPKGEFSAEQKRRVELIYVWQLTDHSGPDDEERVVVAMNFEPDYKEDWPEYVKARKVSEEWQNMLLLEPRPGKRRSAEMKRELSQRFALGPDTSVVNRYLKMVSWVDEFEEHQTGHRGHDEYQVKHRASKYFQYFDELSKGARNDGVAATLGRNDALKGLVFDLLFEEKFANFAQIRDLRYVGEDAEAIDGLREARDEPDIDLGQEKVRNILAAARANNAEVRETGANKRIESFVTWFEKLPLRAFRDTVEEGNIVALLEALKLARAYANEVLGEAEVERILGGSRR